MTQFQPFVMERMMSKYEKEVDYNLSESGVHPMRLDELLGEDSGRIERMLGTELDYPHANGIPELRENIAALYPGATAGNVLVTVGAIEANYNSMRTLTQPGDEVVIMLPNYMQIWGVARNHQLDVKTFALKSGAEESLAMGERQRFPVQIMRMVGVRVAAVRFFMMT